MHDPATMAWPLEASVLVPSVAAGFAYTSGWRTLARRMPDRFGRGRLLAFMAGLGATLLASSAPLDALSGRFLWAHMVQHILLMMVVPPLLWMAAPVAPLLLGLPRGLRRRVAIALAWPPIRWLTDTLTHPAASWSAFVVAFWAWHIPELYELALGSDLWHHVEHACFLAAALLFWRPVILPWPARSAWPRWAMIPYLVLADLNNSALAAILTFSDRVIYASYTSAEPFADGRALEDQALAGVIMWVPGSLAFAVPIVWLVATAITTPRVEPLAPAARPAPLRKGRGRHGACRVLQSPDQ